MPAYQAERTLERTVLAIPPGVADELILVDDASVDATSQLANALGLTVHTHTRNQGYGGNQKSCYRLALGSDADIVVLLHPDYQYEPKAVPLLIAPILAGEADMTFGSRFAGMGDPRAGGMPLYRYVGNRLTTWTQNLFLGTRFTDMHSGMRAYTRRALEALPFLGYPDGFAFDAELLVDAVTSGLRVVEVPIPTRYTEESSSISIRRSLEYIVHGTLYAARQGLTRGRRGRRYLPGWRRQRLRRARGPLTVHRCVSCGSDRMTLRHPANVGGDVPSEEFRCTSSALGAHDDILECPRCGLLSSRSHLSADETIDGYRRSVDRAYLEAETERRELFAWVTDAMARFPVGGRSLLEIGSHAGLFLDVARAKAWTAKGIEPSAWAVHEGRDRFGVDLEEGTVEELEVEDGEVDAVVMLDVLEHLTDPMAALRKIRPMLDGHGLLVVSTLNVDGLHGRFREGRWPWFIRPHLHYFRPQTLVSMLRRAGFEAVEWRVVPRSFHVSYLIDRAAGTSPGAGLLRQTTRLADPRVPVGWLGDVALVIARPRGDGSSG